MTANLSVGITSPILNRLNDVAKKGQDAFAVSDRSPSEEWFQVQKERIMGISIQLFPF
jgi:hypothetical protein